VVDSPLASILGPGFSSLPGEDLSSWCDQNSHNTQSDPHLSTVVGSMTSSKIYSYQIDVTNSSPNQAVCVKNVFEE